MFITGQILWKTVGLSFTISGSTLTNIEIDRDKDVDHKSDEHEFYSANITHELSLFPEKLKITTNRDCYTAENPYPNVN